jgi:hypothetical protein
VSAALFSKDILDFLTLLQQNAVHYLVVGGEAVIQYGHARLTADMDIFYDASTANVARLFRALLEFWGGDVPGIASAEELRPKGKVFQFGRPPNRLDLLNSIDGVSFATAWKGRQSVRFDRKGRSLRVHFIGLEELIRNKRAAGRNRDLDDLQFLLEARKQLRRKRFDRGRGASS